MKKEIDAVPPLTLPHSEGELRMTWSSALGGGEEGGGTGVQREMEKRD